MQYIQSSKIWEEIGKTDWHIIKSIYKLIKTVKMFLFKTESMQFSKKMT